MTIRITVEYSEIESGIHGNKRFCYLKSEIKTHVFDVPTMSNLSICHIMLAMDGIQIKATSKNGHDKMDLERWSELKLNDLNKVRRMTMEIVRESDNTEGEEQ